MGDGVSPSAERVDIVATSFSSSVDDDLRDLRSLLLGHAARSTIGSPGTTVRSCTGLMLGFAARS